MAGNAVFAGGEVGAGATTAAVALLVADADPPAFDAVTVTRILLPRSAETSAYCPAVAPAIEAQLALALSQRFHW